MIKIWLYLFLFPIKQCIIIYLNPWDSHSGIIFNVKCGSDHKLLVSLLLFLICQGNIKSITVNYNFSKNISVSISIELDFKSVNPENTSILPWKLMHFSVCYWEIWSHLRWRIKWKNRRNYGKVARRFIARTGFNFFTFLQ